MREADDFPVLAGECGLCSGDYANEGKSNEGRTNTSGRTPEVHALNGLVPPYGFVFHSPGFSGQRVDNGNIPA